MEEQLIILVQQHECLYNLQHRDYDNNNIKEYIWKEIAAQLGNSVEECKNKWTLLRSYFRRALNRRKTVSGQTAKKIKKWRYEMQMEFLKPHLQERETRTNLDEEFQQEEEIEEHIEDDATQRWIPSPAVSVGYFKNNTVMPRKQPDDLASAISQLISSRTNTQEDPAKKQLMTFFDDIAETMLKFSELDQAELKRDIFSIVNRKELDILRKKQMLQNNAD